MLTVSKFFRLPVFNHGQCLPQDAPKHSQLLLTWRYPLLVRLASFRHAYHLLTQLFTSALLFSALTSMAEIPALYSQRPIVLRHERAALYHPFIEALALTLVDAPITFLTTIVFSIVLYFMTGLQRSASQFLYVTSSIRVTFLLIDVYVASLYCSCLRCLLL